MLADPHTAPSRRRLNGVLALVAAVGWGAFAWSWMPDRADGPSAPATLDQVRSALAQVVAERDRLTAERNQLLTQLGDLQDAQRRLARAREEVATLERMRLQLVEAVEQSRTMLTGGPTPTSPSPPQAPGLSSEQIRAAQEALTALGYGRLQADGRIGPGTRAAIQAFEQASGLAVTGELSGTTIQALEAAAGVSLH